MKVKLTELEHNHEIYSSSINTRANYKANNLPSSSTIKSLHIKELNLTGINYLSLTIESKDSSSLKIEYSEPGYWTCFVLEGKGEFQEGNNVYCILPTQYLCLPLKESLKIVLSPNSRILFINIDFERIQGIAIIGTLARKLLPTMSHTLSEILQCTEDCPIQCIFIESKLLSLLYMVFEEFQHEELPAKNKLPVGLSDQDMQKLRMAKVYIVQNIAKNYTLIELAHEVGLNDFKLKKGFKELFGSTVFTYRHSIRMEKAMDMLQSGYLVNEVSEEIGYKHAHHFSAAFKEYFDVLPSNIKLNPDQSIKLG